MFLVTTSLENSSLYFHFEVLVLSFWAEALDFGGGLNFFYCPHLKFFVVVHRGGTEDASRAWLLRGLDGSMMKIE